MAKPHKAAKEPERASEALALIEHWAFLIIAVMLALATADPLLAAHGPALAATGIGAGLPTLGGLFRR